MDERLSPLALDLVISRVTLAVTKAKCSIKLTPSELDDAKKLHAYLHRNSQTQDEGESSAQIIPEPDVRELLQKSLATYKSRSDFLSVEPSLVTRILSLLITLQAKQEALPREEAAELISSLRKISHHSEPIPSTVNI